MRISEEKHCLLIFNAKLQVQCFQVITEVRLIVPSAELYLKYLLKKAQHSRKIKMFCVQIAQLEPVANVHI